MEKNNKNLEDTSKYGEFISSYFCWNTLDKQKRKVKELENLTSNKKENSKKNKDKMR